MNHPTLIVNSLMEGGHVTQRATLGGYRAHLGVSALMLASLFAQSSMASVVGTCKAGVHYTNIQLAVNGTAAGGTVDICPGTHPEQVSISKNLTLAGVVNGTEGGAMIASPPGGVIANATDLSDGSPIGAQIVVTGGAIVTINNLIIDGANNHISGCGLDFIGIYYQNSSGTINHVVTRNQALSTGLHGCQSGQGIFVESGYRIPGTAAVTVENSSVHGYQKNGITADGSGTTVTISGNDVVGQGPTTGVAENGIQVSDGATGSVYSNKVVDDVYSPGEYGAAGILVVDAGSLTIQSNVVSNTQYGILVYTDGVLNADDNTISGNSVSATHVNDGIDICSNGNTVKSNIVIASDASGIHIDSECTEGGNPTGSGNMVTGNTVNEACAGVLLGSGTGNTVGPNTTFNVGETTYAGDVCPSPEAIAGGSHAAPSAKAHPQPRR
jgi:parallel beta-helix repeat protein